MYLRLLTGTGALIYDPLRKEYGLSRLKSQQVLNKAGSLEFTMPPEHPAYNIFEPYKTLVELYDGETRMFRGRVLYAQDNWLTQRTIVCEGERGFFADAVIRPYLYQDSPANIFSDALAKYNAQVDEFKRFQLGEVTVKDNNDYVRFESESAVTFAEFVDKLVERCGGFITFSDSSDGSRCVNWVSEIGTRSLQSIEFGKNMLDFSNDGQSPDMATALVPFGAQNEDGSRVTITSVTPDGADYIVDSEAVQLRGLIFATKTWDDVHEPANLLRKAQEWLHEHRLLVSSLRLKAADLSILNVDVGRFHLGDMIQVRSAPHHVDGWFQLTERTVDWLNPAGHEITLGKQLMTLSNQSVDDSKGHAAEIDKVINNTKHQVEEIKTATREMSTKVLSDCKSIIFGALDKYVEDGQLEDFKKTVESQFSIMASEMQMRFTTTTEHITNVDGDMQSQFTQLYKYIQFSDKGIKIQSGPNQMTLQLDNEAGIVFALNGAVFGTWDGVDFHTGNIVIDVNQRAQFGNFAIVPRSDGSLSFLKVR